MAQDVVAQQSAAQSVNPIVATTAPEIEVDRVDRERFEAILRRAEAEALAAQPYALLVQSLAMDPALLGQPYRRSPLEPLAPEAPERLAAGLGGFDCVTFVETVLALSATLARGEHDYSDYARHLAELRYRHGEPDYCERLHYFSDWLRSNVAAGRLDDVTASLASPSAALAFAELPQGLDYLSRAAAGNPVLAGSAARRDCVRRSEAELNAALPRNARGVAGFEYLPAARLAAIARDLQGGDIVAWVAEQQGLDVIHVSIVIRKGPGLPGLVHASLRHGRVAYSPDLLAYARSLPRQRGIIVLRPRAPSP